MLERAKRFLFSRQAAYQRVFDRTNIDARIVLEDLAKFCRAHASTFHVEHSMSDRMDGRREVFLRISHHLQLTDEQLWELYGAPTLQPKE